MEKKKKREREEASAMEGALYVPKVKLARMADVVLARQRLLLPLP